MYFMRKKVMSINKNSFSERQDDEHFLSPTERVDTSLLLIILPVTDCLFHHNLNILKNNLSHLGEFVAQYKFTVLLMPNGPLK